MKRYLANVYILSEGYNPRKHTFPPYLYVCIIFLIIATLSSTASVTRPLLKTRDNKESNVAEWNSLSIDELSAIGQKALAVPDSFPKAIKAFTAIASSHEGKILNEKEIRTVISAMNNLGYLYTFHYLDYQKGIRYLNDALELANSSGEKDYIPVIYLNLGGIYTLNQIQFAGKSYSDQAMDGYLKGAKIALELHDVENYMKLLNNILSNIILNPNKQLPEDVVRKFSASKKLLSKDKMFRFTHEHVEAYKAIRAGNYNDARLHYSEMERLVTGFQDEIRYQIMAIYGKSYTYKQQNNWNGALAETQRAIELAKAYKYDDLLVSLYNDARHIEEKLKRPDEADNYYLSYLKLKDSIFEACQMKAVSEFSFRNEMDKMENTVRDLSYRDRLQHVWLCMLGLFSVTVLLFALYYSYSNKKLKQRNEALYRKNMINIEAEDLNINLKKENEELRSELAKHSDHTTDSELTNEKKKYSYSRLNDDDKEVICSKMEDVIENDPDVFTQDFSLGALAKKVGCTQTYLSQVLSEKTGKNFYTIVSERRIKQACKMMADPTNEHLTIEAIASEVGIKSRSNFSSLFKKFTSLTPGEFVRQTREARKNNGA